MLDIIISRVYRSRCLKIESMTMTLNYIDRNGQAWRNIYSQILVRLSELGFHLEKKGVSNSVLKDYILSVITDELKWKRAPVQEYSKPVSCSYIISWYIHMYVDSLKALN